MNKVKKASVNKTEQRVHRLRLQTIFAFVGTLFAVTMILSFVVVQNSIVTMRSKVSSLVSSNNYQQVMNVDSYLEQIKDTSLLFFSDESYYGYDATSDEYDEFEQIQAENKILDRIQDLGVLQNYSDFGILYSNNHTVGWISTESYNLFGDSDMYEEFSSKIDDKNSDSGWFADFNNDHNTIYYVKRLNPNAVMFTSFYTRELESVFQVPGDMQGMHIRLVDEDLVVLYSSDKNEIGKPLDDKISTLAENQGDGTDFSGDYLVTTNTCNSGKWKLVCSMPESVIMKEIYASRNFTFAFSGLLLVAVIVFAFCLGNKLSSPMGKMVSDLTDKAENDQLTGLLNKISYKNCVGAMMELNGKSDIDAFIMMDMDNFKEVNDTLGHNKGDEVLIRFADLIKRHFNQNVVLGRVGGDEFALFARYTNASADEVRKYIDNSLNLFREEFALEFKEECGECRLSLSAGVVIADSGSMEFEEMYKSADAALYSSKRNGKDRFSFYEH
jgi:diguanylate cyclase (GGDEF)-like protein